MDAGFLLPVDSHLDSRYDPGMNMEEVKEALAWACLGRSPEVTVGPTRHELEDEIDPLEVRVAFVDDDMDEIIFRAIISAFGSYFAGRNHHPNSRVVFSLMNRWISARWAVGSPWAAWPVKESSASEVAFSAMTFFAATTSIKHKVPAAETSGPLCYIIKRSPGVQLRTEAAPSREHKSGSCHQSVALHNIPFSLKEPAFRD